MTKKMYTFFILIMQSLALTWLWGASAELCQGVRLDQFTCLIGYSIQHESMTGSSFISYGTNIESPSHQDFRSSVINPS